MKVVKIIALIEAWMAIVIGFAYTISVTVGPQIAHLPEWLRALILVQYVLLFLAGMFGVIHALKGRIQL